MLGVYPGLSLVARGDWPQRCDQIDFCLDTVYFNCASAGFLCPTVLDKAQLGARQLPGVRAALD